MPTEDYLDEHDRAWLDWRWAWLAERIGTERIRSAEVIGTIEAFVQTDRAISRGAMDGLAKKIAEVLGLTAFPIRVVHGSTETHDDAARFEAAVTEAQKQPDTIMIAVDEPSLADPKISAFFMMKQIIAEHLVLSGWLDPEAGDAGEVSDMAAVQLGVGIILANNVLVDETVTYGTAVWGRLFLGTSLSVEALAYALARFALQREEPQPMWVSRLRSDPRAWFKRYLAELVSAPPATNTTKPEGVMSPAQRFEALAEEEGLHEQGWSEQDFVPPNPKDFAGSDTSPVYCKACAYNVAQLPAGECPGCGIPFDPEDLRTVTTTKPMIVSEATHHALAAGKKLILWLAIGFALITVIGVSVLMLGKILGIKPGP